MKYFYISLVQWHIFVLQNKLSFIFNRHIIVAIVMAILSCCRHHHGIILSP